MRIYSCHTMDETAVKASTYSGNCGDLRCGGLVTNSEFRCESCSKAMHKGCGYPPKYQQHLRRCSSCGPGKVTESVTQVKRKRTNAAHGDDAFIPSPDEVAKKKEKTQKKMSKAAAKQKGAEQQQLVVMRMSSFFKKPAARLPEPFDRDAEPTGVNKGLTPAALLEDAPEHALARQRKLPGKRSSR